MEGNNGEIDQDNGEENGEGKLYNALDKFPFDEEDLKKKPSWKQ